MRKQRRDKRLGGLANLRDLDLQLALRGLHPPGAIAVPKSRVEIAQPALVVRPALIARPAQPGVELVLDRALDDQSGTELRQLRQRLARVLTHPNGQQLVDLVLDLRRRRYGSPHGVGLPSWSCQDFGEPTPWLLRSLGIYSSWETRPRPHPVP